MKFPATSDELKANGWDYDNDSHCKKCEQPIEWWVSPNGRNVALEVQKKSRTMGATSLHEYGDVRLLHAERCPGA